MTAMALRLGPLLFCIGVALYRAVWLSTQLSGMDLSELGYLLLADLPVLGILGLLAFFEGVRPPPARRPSVRPPRCARCGTRAGCAPACR
jgi:hypothetical protein